MTAFYGEPYPGAFLNMETVYGQKHTDEQDMYDRWQKLAGIKEEPNWTKGGSVYGELSSDEPIVMNYTNGTSTGNDIKLSSDVKVVGNGILADNEKWKPEKPISMDREIVRQTIDVMNQYDKMLTMLEGYAKGHGMSEKEPLEILEHLISERNYLMMESAKQIQKTIPPTNKMPQLSSVRCECGGEKAGTTHSDWCPKGANNV